MGIICPALNPDPKPHPEPQATCLLSQCRNGELLTGVAFAGDGANTVAACAYDMDSLVLYRPVS